MKKLLLLFPLICIQMIYGQNLNFTNLSSMTLRRGAIACSTDSNHIYVSNGFSSTGTYTKEIEKYDLATDTWSVFTNSLVKKRYASSVIVGNNLYLFNGQDSSGNANDKMEIVNLTNGNITLSTPNPLPRYSGGAAEIGRAHV